MTEAKRYARVEDGEIKESYVSFIHIQNRRHDTALYHEVVHGEKPAINQFQYLTEVLTVKGRQVFASYEVKEKTADMVLSELHQARAKELGGDEHMPGMMNVPDIVITTVDPVVTGKVLELVKKYIGEALDSFARERGYDGIVSLATYATSNETKFKVEGQRGVDLRDMVYSSLYVYQTSMLTGEAFVPKNMTEVISKLPAFTWE